MRTALILLAVGTAACGRGGTPSVPGVATEPTQTPFTYDIFADTTPGSHCDRAAVERTLTAVITRTYLRSDSRVRLWRFDVTGEDTENVGEFSVPARAASHAARHRTRERWRQEMAAALAPAVEHLFTSAPPRRSPIADALSRIAAATTPGNQRTIIALTDGRETEAAMLECGTLPNERMWLRALDHDDLLTPGSLGGIRIEFAEFRAGRIPGRGCRSSSGRDRALASLWRAALVHAGARGEDVRIDPGDPALVVEGNNHATNPEESE